MVISRKITKSMAAAVILAGIAVIIGWIFNISFLKSISAAWVSMKFDTAIAFVLSGASLYFIAKALEGEFDKAQVALAITSMVIMLLMGVLFLSAFLGVRTGIEDLFIKETIIAPKTVTPGRPSLPTMLNFILIALAGFLTMLNAGKLSLQLKIIGALIGITGIVAITGYIFNAPQLYYYIEGLNSAMALHTAFLFMLLGIGLQCL